MKIQAPELDGLALDWAAGKAASKSIGIASHGGAVWVRLESNQSFGKRWSPSTDWSQGGPLIEQHGIRISDNGKGFKTDSGHYYCAYMNEDKRQEHPACGSGSILVSACRCLVANKLGLSVDVPSELLTTHAVG